MVPGSFPRRSLATLVALACCASVCPARAADDRQLTMTVQRDKVGERACVEYSWVPEGKRHNVVLAPQERSGKSPDAVSGEVRVTHVQVYVVSNGGAGFSSLSTAFPAQADRSRKVVGALVDVVKDSYALGTLRYDDGTTSKPVKIKFAKGATKCPTLQAGAN